jgi:FtsP/CotA-like multicopper oxidase with cupredoxin domain
MSSHPVSRRSLLRAAGALVPCGALLGTDTGLQTTSDSPADYSLTIATKPVELAPDRIVSATTYNGQFPGPLLRLKEGERVTVDIDNQTDIPEQLHWHEQFVSTDVDGVAEEGTPFIPPHGKRRISFIPGPSGFRFYHTHVRAGGDLSLGQYSGLVGPVYIEPKQHVGNYDREVLLTLKEFQPTFSRGGDMAMDFLSPAETVASLKTLGETKMKASLAAGMPHGLEVGYDAFTINGRMLGHGEPVMVKQGERILFHILNGKCYRNSESGSSRAQLCHRRHGRERVAKIRSSSRTMAWNGGTYFRYCRNESPWYMDYERSFE